VLNGHVRTALNEESKQLGIQLVTILGTLATAVSAFYFATAAAQEKGKAVQKENGTKKPAPPGGNTPEVGIATDA
jgi:hypothetical protein